MDEQTKNAIEQTKKESTKRESKAGEDNKIKVILGEKKSVTIKPWTGKTKKKVRKIFEYVERPEDVDFISIMKTLLYDYIEEDIYLNEGEQQYVLSKIRDISISDFIEKEIECPECSEYNFIKSYSKDFIHYKENNLPIEFNKNIKFIDINKLEEFENACNLIIESEDYDGITTEVDIEIALHIKIDELDIKETINYIDNLPLKETSIILEKLRENLPECKMYHEKQCKKCKNKVKFPIDITEDIFESLIK